MLTCSQDEFDTESSAAIQAHDQIWFISKTCYDAIKQCRCADLDKEV